MTGNTAVQQWMQNWVNIVNQQSGYTNNNGNNGNLNKTFSGSLLPTTMNIASQTIGLDLVSVKPMSAPSVQLIYNFYTDDVIREEIFVCIKESEEYNINGIVLKNDIDEEISFHIWDEYFVTIVESRKQKLKEINEKKDI